MINGKIDSKVPDDVAKLPNWKAPIKIGVHKGANFEAGSGKFSKKYQHIKRASCKNVSIVVNW